MAIFTDDFDRTSPAGPGDSTAGTPDYELGSNWTSWTADNNRGAVIHAGALSQYQEWNFHGWAAPVATAATDDMAVRLTIDTSTTSFHIALRASDAAIAEGSSGAVGGPHLDDHATGGVVFRVQMQFGTPGQVTMMVDGAYQGPTNISGSTAYDDGLPHTYEARVVGDTASLYIDGALKFTRSDMGTLPTGSTRRNMAVGWPGDGDQQHVDDWSSGDYPLVLQPTPAVVTAAVEVPAPSVSTGNVYRVADRGSVSNTTSQSSTAVDMAAAGSITVGNYLIARVAGDNSGTNGAAPVLTVSETRSNVWTVLGPALQDPGAANAGTCAWICYCEVDNAYTNGDDITFNWATATTAKSIVIEEWANVHATTPVAVAAVTGNAAGTAPSVSITPGAVGQLVYGATAVEGPTGDTFTQDSDTTDGVWATLTRLSTGHATAASNQTVNGVSKLVSGTTAQTWNTTITSRDWASIVVVFDKASGATNATATPTVVTAAVSNPSVTVATGTSLSATVVTAAVSVPVPGITASGGATVGPSDVTATVSNPAPTVATGTSHAATTITAAVSVPAVTVTLHLATVATVVTAAVSVPAPTVTTGTSHTATAVTAAVSVPTPGVSASGGATASPSDVTAAATVPAPTVATSASVNATVVSLELTVGTAAVTALSNITVAAAVVTLALQVVDPAVFVGERFLTALRLWAIAADSRTHTVGADDRTFTPRP